MAGAIVFSSEDVVGMSTFLFRWFARLLRGAFRLGEEDVLEEVNSLTRVAELRPEVSVSRKASSP